MINFNFLKDLNLKDFFSSIDIFFANHLNPSFEDEAIFLAYLFFISRNGFVSLMVENNDIYPKPNDINFETNSELNYEEILQKIISGSKIVSDAKYVEKNYELFPNHPIVKFQNYFYLQKNFVFETFILKNLSTLLFKNPDDIFDKNIFFENLKNEPTLYLEQKEAIKNAYEKSISFIVGGPGCGKTYLASHLIKIFYSSFNNLKKNELKIVATSFTGKATSHLKKTISKIFQDINIEAKTLHLLLNIKERKSKYFGKEKLDFDLIIVDEASMIDIRLFAYLLDSIKDRARVVFIGDPNQLSPIEGGNVFSELINHNIISTAFLKRAIRFDNKLILDLAGCVNDENTNEFIQILQKVNFYKLDDNVNLRNTIFDEAEKYFLNFSDKRLDIDELFEKTNKFRILSSVKKGLLGVDVLNKELFLFFFEQIKFNQFFYVPIMITKNNYQLELFNGDLGILEYKIFNKQIIQGKAFFKIDEKIKEFPIHSIRSYEYAYAISIHKSQGSEFESAIIIIPEIAQNFGKELLYTALTRVKKKIHIISTEEHLIKMLKKSTLKKSGFIKRLMFENIIDLKMI